MIKNDIWNKYIKKEILAITSYSKIYKGEIRKSGNYVAIKEINKERFTLYTKLTFKKKEQMKQLNHKIIIETYDTKEYFYIVLKLFMTNLENYLKLRGEGLSIEEVYEILKQLENSFKNIQKEKLLFIDLKPSNILISLNKINKTIIELSKYGNYGKINSYTKSDLKSINSYTLSPEIMIGEEKNSKSDIWSLGIIIYYMLNNKYPYQGLTESAIYKDICSNKKLDKTDDEDLNDLVNKMLIVDLKDRISWDNYFEHPFFKKTFSQNFPVFDFLCKKHMKTIYYYCKNCQLNICEDCKNQHDNHILIPFHEIGFTNEEINQINFLNNEIKTNFNKFNKIKNEINSLIDQIKLINKNNEIYQNDSSNNYKKYLIDCLVNVNKKIEIKPNILLFNLKQDKKEEKFQNYKSSLLQNNTLTINYHKDEINHLLQLQDGRLISCSDDYSINIYETNTFGLQISIKEHSYWIPSFTELKDGRIISCSGDNTFKIIRLIGDDDYIIEQTIEEHNNWVYKVIEIKTNQLISVSSDGSMKIWIENDEKKFKCISTILFQSKGSFCNILELNQNEFVTSSVEDKCIKFWNSNDFSYITTIYDIETDCGFKRMCLLENDILCVGGSKSKGFYLIKISTHQLIENILGPKEIISIIKCLDGFFLCSIVDEEDNNSLVKYRYDNLKLEKVFQKEKAHNGEIWSILELNDGSIVSAGADNLIKLWT